MNAPRPSALPASSDPTSTAAPVRTLGAPAPPTTQGSPRLHHLDALRAGALLLGVVLHTVLGFVPGLPWLFVDSRPVPWAMPTMVVIHLFRMILFMMLAGYFGRMVLHRRGTRAYLRDRVLRIGLPLLAFWPVAVLSLPVVIVVGALLTGEAPPSDPSSDASGAGAAASPGLLQLFTPGQLWFLLLLLEIVGVVVLVRAVLVRTLGSERAGGISRRIGRILSAPGGVLLAAVPYAAGLLVQSGGPGGIQEPTTILPVPGASIAYGGAFLVGWFLHADEGALRRISRGWPVALVLAVALSSLVLLASALLLDETGSPTAPGAAPLLAVLVPLAGWTWVRALLGAAARLVRREIPAVRYLADASYWIYLMHLPLVVALGIAMADLPLPALVKAAANIVLTTALLVLLYDLAVRSTWIGRWLNGHRRPRAILVRRSGRGARRSR